jgi:hypothetical protein
MRIASQGAGYVNGPTLTGVTLTGIEAWFETDSTTNHRDIVGVYKTNTDRLILSHIIGGKVRLTKDHSTVALESDAPVSSNVSHHVAVWYESGSNKTYMMIDGIVQQATFTGNAIDVTHGQLYIGAYRYNSTVYKRYLGEIDEVAIYNTPVTASTFTNFDAQAPHVFTYEGLTPLSRTHLARPGLPLITGNQFTQTRMRGSLQGRGGSDKFPTSAVLCCALRGEIATNAAF